LIDKDKLSKEDREKLEKRADIVRGYVDEAHLFAGELSLTSGDIFSVALMLAIIGER
jgi:hypothetical protein